MNSSIEIDFHDKIDCRFPYGNIKSGKALIKEAIAISPDAVFKVMHELCRIPASKKNEINISNARILLDQILTHYQHPLINAINTIALKNLVDEEIPITETLAVMEKVRLYRGMYNALMIIYFSSNDINGELEDRYNAIINDWGKTTNESTLDTN